MPGKVYCIEDIKQLLPCKYPMLLIDRLWEEDENKYVGLKNVSITEEFFNGHFPGHPIMPGVLQLEATLQVATVAAQKFLDPGNKQYIYLKSMANAKFRKPTRPGDRLLIEVTIKEKKDGEVKVSAINKNNSGICSQVEMILSVKPCKSKVEKPELFTKHDRTDNVAMDVNNIMELIPHRYPFLFIDYIASVDGVKVTAIKNVTYNDPILHSYISGFSVLPGTIQSEIVAQAGCAHTMARPQNKGKVPYFMGIAKAEYYHFVYPGDQLRIELTLPESSSKFGKGQGEIYVENKLVSFTEMTFALVDGK